MSTGTALLAALALALVVVGALAHARLVALRARVADAWARIDAELRHRHELVPRLVEAARAGLRHETGTLLAVDEATNAAAASRRAIGEAAGDATDDPIGAATDLRELAAAEAVLSRALVRLDDVMESYPELRAGASVREPTAELRASDDRIARARRTHADAVSAYEAARVRLPGSRVASVAGFREATPFDVASPVHRDRVDVSFA